MEMQSLFSTSFFPLLDFEALEVAVWVEGLIRLLTHDGPEPPGVVDHRTEAVVWAGAGQRRGEERSNGPSQHTQNSLLHLVLECRDEFSMDELALIEYPQEYPTTIIYYCLLHDTRDIEFKYGFLECKHTAYI